MIQIGKNRQCLPDDLMGFISLDVGHKADTAGFVFEAGIVKALFLR
jgi:hypothetical protein